MPARHTKKVQSTMSFAEAHKLAVTVRREALEPGSRKSQHSVVRCYERQCAEWGIPAWPVTLDNLGPYLALYTIARGKSAYSIPTIKSHLRRYAQENNHHWLVGHFAFGPTPTATPHSPAAAAAPPLGHLHGTGGPHHSHGNDGGGVISADALMAVLGQDTARDVNLVETARHIYRGALQHPSILARESAFLLLACKYDNRNQTKAFLSPLDTTGNCSELLGRAPPGMKSQPTFTATVLGWIVQDDNRYPEHTRAFHLLLQGIQLFEDIQDFPWSHQVHLLLDALHLYCLGTPLQAATGGWPAGTLLPDPAKLQLDTGHLSMRLSANRVARTGNSWGDSTINGYAGKRKARAFNSFVAQKPSFSCRGGGGGGDAGYSGASYSDGGFRNWHSSDGGSPRMERRNRYDRFGRHDRSMKGVGSGGSGSGDGRGQVVSGGRRGGGGSGASGHR